MTTSSERGALLTANGLCWADVDGALDLWSEEQPKARKRVAASWLDEQLDGSDDGAFLRGAAFALAAPCLPAASKFDFVSAAASITSLLDTAAFGRGYAAIAGEPLVAWKLNDHHTLYFVFEGRDRRFAITERLREEWTVHPERIERAAASMLLHRTRAEFRPVEGASYPMERAFHGDGADAARLTILATHLFDRARHGLMLAAASPDHLFVAPLSRDGAAAFAEAAFQHEEAARRALPPVVYFIEEGSLLATPREWVASEHRFA